MNVSLSSQCLAIFYFYKAYTLRQWVKGEEESGEHRTGITERSRAEQLRERRGRPDVR